MGGPLACYGKVGGKNSKFTIDTGAGLCLIDKSKVGEMEKIPNSNITITGITGNSVKDEGFAVVPIQFGNIYTNWPMMIMENCPCDVLIGMDFLDRFGFNIDLKGSKLVSEVGGTIKLHKKFLEYDKADGIPVQRKDEINNLAEVKSFIYGITSQIKNAHQILRNPDAKPPRIRVSSSFVLPARTRCTVPVQMSNMTPFQTAMVEPLKRMFTRHRVLVPAMLVSGTTSAIEMINPTFDDIKMHSGTVIGVCKLIECEEEKEEVCKVKKANAFMTKTTENNENSYDPKKLDINPSLSDEDRKKVETLIKEFEDIFAWDGKTVGRCTTLPFNIDTGNAQPISSRPYRVSEIQKFYIRKYVDEMLKARVVSPSNSPWASPVVLARKKGDPPGHPGSRFCVDYRKLHGVVKKINYPLPLIEDVIDNLRGAKYFTVADLCAGYWQCELMDEAKPKTCFVTPDGAYEFNVVPFGINNAPKHFSKLVAIVLSGLQPEVVQCYIDDSIICSKSVDEHIDKLRKVFERFRLHNLKFKPSKCKFLYNEIEALGYIVNGEGIKPNPNGQSAVRDMNEPRTLKQLQSIIGLFSYFRKFIEKFADKVAPMQKIVSSGTFKYHQDWKDEQKRSFETLKNEILNPNILTIFDPLRETRLLSDASTTGLGCALAQLVDAVEKPVAFVSRSLKKAERNWTTTEQELLAIIFGVEKFKCYLYGLDNFKIIVDHHSLCFLTSTKRELTPKLSRMLLKLTPYNFTIHHKSGKKHYVPDCLSRCSLPLKTGEETEAVSDIPVYRISVDEMSKAQMKDVYIAGIIANMSDKGKGKEWEKKYVLKDGILFRKNEGEGRKLLMVIPFHLRKAILEEAHDDPVGSHMGFSKTFDKIRTRYYWDNFKRDIYEYVKSCSDCQTRKIPRQGPAGMMQLVPIPDTAFEKVGIDIMGNFPQSDKGNKYIVTAICYNTRYLETRAIADQRAETIAKFFLEKIILRHGAPKEVTSDRGAQFLGEIFREINRQMGTQHQKTTSYRPNANGAVERSHAKINESISMYCSANQNDWDLFLPHITFAINTCVHETTKMTPFELVFGRQVIYPAEAMMPFEIENEGLKKSVDQIRKARILAKENIEKKQKEYAERFNKKRRNVEFNVGDKVLVHKPVGKKGKATKFLHPFFGPFTITKQLSDVNFEIEARRGKNIIKDVVHVEKMKRYIERERRSEFHEASSGEEESESNPTRHPGNGAEPGCTGERPDSEGRNGETALSENVTSKSKRGGSATRNKGTAQNMDLDIQILEDSDEPTSAADEDSDYEPKNAGHAKVVSKYSLRPRKSKPIKANFLNTINNGSKP